MDDDHSQPVRPATPARTVYSPDDVHRILGHAASIDALLREGIDRDELRVAAIEAGISEEAFERALSNDATVIPVLDPEPLQPVSLIARVRSAIAAPIALAVGWAFGAIARNAAPPHLMGDPGPDTTRAATLLIVLALATAARTRGVNSQRTFQIHNALLWVGFIAGWCTIHGRFFSDVAAIGIIAGTACAAVGGVIVGVREMVRSVPALAMERLDEPGAN